MLLSRERYNLLYEQDGKDVIYLKRYELKDGYKLFEVVSSYATNLGGTYYYVIEKSKTAAKKLFLSSYPWLDKIKSVRICTEDETETIVNSPSKFIII